MSAWFRRQPELDSVRQALSITDMDYMLEKYLTPVDGKGTRTIKALMILEVKCYNAEPSPAQAENLYIHHFLLYGNFGKHIPLPHVGTCAVRHFGVYVLSLPGVEPQDAGHCRWGRFNPHGVLQWTTIPCVWLADICSFRIRPDRLALWELRRHHKDTTVVCDEETPLGFVVPTVIIKKS
jgi:hypothetical protein